MQISPATRSQTLLPMTIPCLSPYCSKFSGFRAFHRADHLTQHLRNDHNIDDSEGFEGQSVPKRRGSRKRIPTCPHEGCSYHSQASTSPGQPKPKVFQTSREFTRHLREVHDDSSFPCIVAGCPRVGRKGFFREGDLIRHYQ